MITEFILVAMFVTYWASTLDWSRPVAEEPAYIVAQAVAANNL